MNIFLSPVAFAIDSSNFSPAAYSNLGQLITIIVGILTSLTGAATAIFVVIAGIKFITSSGDPKAIASARSTLTYALIGLVVTILAFIILQTTQYFLGVSGDFIGAGNGGGGQAATCSVSTPSVAQGGQITINAANFGPGPLPVRMIGVYSLLKTDLAILNSDPFSVTVTINSSQALGSYRVYVDAGGFGFVFCTPDPISVTAASPGVANMQLTPTGSTITASWNAIPGWPSGATYYLGLYPSSATGCPPPSSGNILASPPSFTNGAGGTYTLPASPVGIYKIALYTFAPGPLSNCPIFRLNGTSATTCSLADLNHDGSVTSLDTNLMAAIFGAKIGTANYIASYDLNHDGTINSLDLAILSAFIGQTC